MVFITSIEPAGPDRRARRLTLDGPDHVRITAAAVVRDLAFEAGDAIELSELEESEERMARERALRLVGYRERCVAEVSLRLTRDGYPQPLAQRLVGRFEELGLIDDARFAAAWVRMRVASGFGAVRIRRELVTKGVSEDIVDAAIAEFAPDDPVESARAILRGAVAVDSRSRSRLIRKLMTRGFEARVAAAAVGDTVRGQSDSE